MLLESKLLKRQDKIIKYFRCIEKVMKVKKLNLVVVFNPKMDQVLFCIRAKEPYKGLYNFVGGKVETSFIK